MNDMVVAIVTDFSPFESPCLVLGVLRTGKSMIDSRSSIFGVRMIDSEGGDGVLGRINIPGPIVMLLSYVMERVDINHKAKEQKQH